MEQKYVVRTLHGKKYRRLAKIKWTEPDTKEIWKIERDKEKQFAHWAGEHRARIMAASYTDEKKFDRDTLHHHLNQAILDPRRLRADTGQDPPTFFYAAAVLEDILRGDVYAPLLPYGIDEHKASWGGNRCKLRVEYMLHMLLHQLRTNCSQQVLAGRYGIDQAAVSRYLWLIRHILNTLGVMPTPWTLAEDLREGMKKFVQEYIGGVLNVDCKHSGIEAPTDKESNNEAYSGKAHDTTSNTPFLCRTDGVIVGMGDPQPGHMSDINVLREGLPNLGWATASFVDPRTPHDERIDVNADRAMIGIDREWVGARMHIPHKRKPGQERLAPWQRVENYWMNSDRAIIETNFSRINAYDAFAGRFRGTIEDLGISLNVTAGFINLQRIMGTIDPARSHRKGRRPGRPRKRGSRGRKPLKTFG